MNLFTKADISVFGPIDGIPVGKTWKSRAECMRDGVHPVPRAGIYSREDDGARSVVLSGGCEDDTDEGDTFIYTGSGGKEHRDGPQTYDQSFEDTYANKALLVSSRTGRPVRVVRGSGAKSVYAPVEGYRYDGLYTVVKAWTEKGKSGYSVCRYKFVRCPGQSPIPRQDGLLEPVAGPSKANARSSNSTPSFQPRKPRRLSLPLCRSNIGDPLVAPAPNSACFPNLSINTPPLPLPSSSSPTVPSPSTSKGSSSIRSRPIFHLLNTSDSFLERRPPSAQEQLNVGGISPSFIGHSSPLNDSWNRPLAWKVGSGFSFKKKKVVDIVV